MTPAHSKTVSLRRADKARLRDREGGRDIERERDREVKTRKTNKERQIERERDIYIYLYMYICRERERGETERERERERLSALNMLPSFCAFGDLRDAAEPNGRQQRTLS